MLTGETMRLLGDGPIVDQDRNSESVPKLEKVRFVLLHFNVVRNDHLQNSKLLLHLSRAMLLVSYFLLNQKY